MNTKLTEVAKEERKTDEVILSEKIEYKQNYTDQDGAFYTG